MAPVGGYLKDQLLLSGAMFVGVGFFFSLRFFCFVVELGDKVLCSQIVFTRRGSYFDPKGCQTGNDWFVGVAVGNPI